MDDLSPPVGERDGAPSETDRIVARQGLSSILIAVSA
jgi:hypothetical protein